MEKQITTLKAIKSDIARANNSGLIEGLYWRLSSFILRQFGDKSIYFVNLNKIHSIDYSTQIDNNKGKLLGIIDQILDEIEEPVVENIKSKSPDDKDLKAYCYKCDDNTNQTVLFKDYTFGPQEIVGRNEDGNESESYWVISGNIWTISKCHGCENLNFTHINKHLPDSNPKSVFHFPKKLIRERPVWLVKLPIKYLEILNEIYATLNEELFLLSLAGTRILLDIYIVDKVGDIGSFQQKVAKLVKEGIITQSKATVLETTIEAGNAATHRGFKPDKDTLFDILDIIENLLQSEIVDRQEKKIKDKTPKRLKKN